MIEPFDLIDLSVPLEHQSASEPVPGSIHYVKHEDEGLKQSFWVSCLHVKIAAASAVWCRAIAMVPKHNSG